MAGLSYEALTETLKLADELAAGREMMQEPQDLPGRYGRVVRAIDHQLDVTKCEAVVGGGWAVWRHGFPGRVTYDIDIVLPADRIDEVLKAASVSGFRILPQPEGRWPKMLHKETDVKVDILPEGARPGVAGRPAPTTIGHPSQMGAVTGRLTYINLASLFELKLAAGRSQDWADVVKLIRQNRTQLDDVRWHLETVHAAYVELFDQGIEEANVDDEK